MGRLKLGGPGQQPPNCTARSDCRWIAVSRPLRGTRNGWPISQHVRLQFDIGVVEYIAPDRRTHDPRRRRRQTVGRPAVRLQSVHLRRHRHHPAHHHHCRTCG